MGNDEAHIGKRLTRARETAGLCVDDVVIRTKLPRAIGWMPWNPDPSALELP